MTINLIQLNFKFINHYSVGHPNLKRMVEIIRKQFLLFQFLSMNMVFIRGNYNSVKPLSWILSSFPHPTRFLPLHYYCHSFLLQFKLLDNSKTPKIKIKYCSEEKLFYPWVPGVPQSTWPIFARDPFLLLRSSAPLTIITLVVLMLINNPY